MRQYFSLSHISAGFVAILVGYTSAAAIVFQAALSAGATPAQVSSWLWAVGIAMGIMGIALSVYYKHPIMIAWSTPGAALLVTSLPGIAYSDAIGAFLFCSALITICGITGWFDKIMKLVPQSLATAMLAGVLLRFGLNVFPAFEAETLIVGAMVLTYIIGKWRQSPYAIPLTFAIGVILSATQGKIDMSGISLDLTVPVWQTPTFDLSVLIGIGLPLFIVTMASQNVPGIAVLRAHGYQTPASPLIGWTGAMGLVFAPFGGYAFNMAAITAALCMGEDVDKDPARRYLATVWVGVFYFLAGLFGATVAGFFAAFPSALVAAIAGLALLGTIANSLNAALSDAKGREAAILTFIITASGGTFLSVGTPFWGLLVGLAVYGLNQRFGRG
ncbi:benzoate/H(+) symporter BenE family transporter [Terasakiella pusilla]|jgi:benzoate membrane transport protein|uniref:benzoate/H(+) symporter BenE family transporter n=1 Tax=Terasakiella pusilla TaxID=64973 RepID=UPI0004907D9B|nr:benzoate/H(+) symporter BenE family transporter [Terasakiella pusilla]